MYTDHFGFTAPLEGDGIARDDRIFRGESQRALETELSFALRRGDAVAVVYGPAGAGKSTLAADTLRESITRLAIGGLTDTPQTPHELLEQLLIEFGFSPYKMSRTERRTQWRQYLGEMATTGTRVGIVVENADRLSTEVLAELEALTGPDIRGNAGANLVLTARLPIPGLDSDPRLTALRQRCRTVVEVAFLTEAETAAYLRFRLDLVGGDWDAITESGLDARIHAVTDGAIRMIDNVVESCLARAAHAGATVVSVALLDRVVASRPGMRLAAAAVPTTAASVVPPAATGASAPPGTDGESFADGGGTEADVTAATDGAAATGTGNESAAESESESAYGDRRELAVHADADAPAVTEPPSAVPAMPAMGGADDASATVAASADAPGSDPSGTDTFGTAAAPTDATGTDARGTDASGPGPETATLPSEPATPAVLASDTQTSATAAHDAPTESATDAEPESDATTAKAAASDSSAADAAEPATEEPVFDIPVLEDAVGDERFDLSGASRREHALGSSPDIDGELDADDELGIGEQSAKALPADDALSLDDALCLDEDPGFDEELPIDGSVLDALLSLPDDRTGEPSIQRMETEAELDSDDDEDLSDEDRQQIEMLEAFANAEALEEISESMAETIFGDVMTDDASESLRAAFDGLMGDTPDPADESGDQETPAAGGRDAAGGAR